MIEFTADGSKEEHVVYVIAIPANRYDLLCIEGFARAIRIFISVDSAPMYKAITPGTKHIMYVDPSVNQIRPYVVCAVLRGITFDKRRYKSFIDLQEKLHQNICRKRTYVAIGTHDMDTVEGPFHYKALAPELIRFVPLTEDNNREFEGKELLDFYREDPSAKHLKPYTDIIYDSPVYPVIMDNKGTVLSMPPIINSKHSRLQLHTSNVFIECTGTDITKANIVLDTIITMFSEYCSAPFTTESVDIVYEHSTVTSPLLSERTCEALVTEVNGTIGINITPEEMCKLCTRMQLGPASYDASRGAIQVRIPPTRSDILHAVDVIEDVAIAFGYNNIPLRIPTTLTVGGPLPINQFADLLRAEVSRGGFVEMLTHGLCSTAENFSHLRRPVGPAVSLANPANVEYEVVRTTLLPGALKTLAFNKSISHKEGVRLFEISDVVVPADNEVGAQNIRKLVALYASYSAGFEFIHGLVDRIFTCAQIQPEESYARNSLSIEEIADRKRVARANVVYFVRPSSDPCFFEGMGSDIILREVRPDQVVDSVVGVFGVVHPQVLHNYEISYPCSVVELNVEAIM